MGQRRGKASQTAHASDREALTAIVGMSTQNTASAVASSSAELVQVRFDGFERLPAAKGQDRVRSPDFTCFGRPFCIELWPGGKTKSSDGKVAIYLVSTSQDVTEVQATFIVRGSKKQTAAYFYFASDEHSQQSRKEGTENAWGTKNFADRAALVGALQSGVLTVDVYMKQTGSVGEKTRHTRDKILPNHPLTNAILGKFMDKASSDIAFEVGVVQVKSEGEKRAKAEPSTFHAHRLILQGISSKFMEICESGENIIPITDVKPDVFGHLLYHVYGGNVSDEELTANAKEIIHAADKFGVPSLKLQADYALVASASITIDNVMEHLLFADEYRCALLKETALDFLVENKAEAKKMAREGRVPGKLFADLLEAFDVTDNMRVKTLREKLQEKGLEIDGTKEELIDRLSAED